jgi:hypothetical protein
LLPRALASAALLALGACSQAPAPPAARIWTLADIEALYAAGAPSTKAIAANAGLPGGIAIGHILDSTTHALFQRPAFADHYGVTYATTEVWANYPQVWTQPMYVPVTGWVDGVPQKLVGMDGKWHPVFSVEPGSAFYSPFWQAVYFTVPLGTTTATYTTVKQILDAGFPLVPGEGWTIPIVPADVTSPVAGPIPGTGWWDGAKVSFLNFGQRLFNWDPVTNVVDETPLFVMVTRDAAGNLAAPYLPTVGGTGPLGTHAGLAAEYDGQPIYASYWRLYTVEIPATARVIVDDTLQYQLAAAGFPDLGVAPDPTMADPTIVGRVVLNPDCMYFDPSATGPMACQYLDTQAAVESNIDPGAIQPTDVTVTCPFLTYKDGVALAPITK